MLFEKVFQFLFKLSYRAGDYLRGIWLLMTIRLCGGICEGIPRVGKGVIFKYPPHAGVSFGKNCYIGAFCMFDVPRGGVLSIGNNVKMTAGVFMSAINVVKIGDDCLIAEWVSIRDAQHRYAAGSLIREQGLDLGQIVLESDVWVGKSSSIFMDAFLQQGCIVGAGGMVKQQKLDANAVYVGVPVRKIAERNGD